MARRRAADGPLLPGDDLQTPPPPAVAVKPKGTFDRLLRFAKQRPVTFLVVLATFAGGAFLVVSLARMLLHLVVEKQHHLHAADHQKVPAGGAARDANNAATAHTAAKAHEEIAHGGAPGDTDVHDHDVHEHAAAADAVKDAAAHGDASTPGDGCVRTLPAGRLGSTTPLCVTAEYFFDLESAGRSLGTVQVGVFGKVVPKSAANFHALVTCSGAFADPMLCFRGDGFHRIVPNFVVQGGSKATGRSIYGGTFREEQSADHHSFLQHSEHGVLAWAEYPIGSQFYFLLADDAKYLDKNHVVFAVVTEGWNVVKEMGAMQRKGERPAEAVSIARCGQLGAMGR